MYPVSQHLSNESIARVMLFYGGYISHAIRYSQGLFICLVFRVYDIFLRNEPGQKSVLGPGDNHVTALDFQKKTCRIMIGECEQLKPFMDHQASDKSKRPLCLSESSSELRWRLRYRSRN